MSNYIVPKQSNVNKLVEYSGVKNVQIVNAFVNPYKFAPGLKQDFQKDAPVGLSSLGTPILSDLGLLPCSYTDNLTGQPVNLEEDNNPSVNSYGRTGLYMVLPTVLITIEQGLRVIKTEIQGRDGTVKEYIGKNDARITINGIITIELGQKLERNGVYPRNATKRLKAWLDAPVTKGVSSWWLNNLGITDLVVDSYSFPQVAGGASYQMFTIECSSDYPVELRIIEPIG